MRFVIAAGGTTGHLSPGLALAQILKDKGHEVTFIGSARGPEGRIVSDLGYRFHAVDVEGRGSGIFSVRNLRAAAKLAAATARCVKILIRSDPCVVVGTGGYAGLPACLAARIRGIPLVLHEQNSVPGLANRVARRFAVSIGAGFPGSERLLGGSAILVGNPVRPELLNLDRALLAPRAQEEFGLTSGLPTVLVFGGSQGAQSINRAVSGAYDGLRKLRIQILHLTGPSHTGSVQAQVQAQVRPGDQIVYRILGYTDSMELAYACSDLAICRSGASTIAELAAVGLPAVLVPLPISLDEDQRHNAQAVVDSEGARMILDREFNPRVVIELIEGVLFNRAMLDKMAQAIGTLARPDAARKFAGLVLAAAGIPIDGLSAQP